MRSAAAAAVVAVVAMAALLPDAQATATKTAAATTDTCTAPAGNPNPATDATAWRQRDLANLVCATQRQQDELSNPAFLRLWAVESGERDPGTETAALLQPLEHPTHPVVNGTHDTPSNVTDPFRDPERWMQEGRGHEQLLTMVATTGAHLNARLYVPNGRGPFPGVVMIPGLQAYNEVYTWLGEGLAEAGYIVLIPDPQGQGGSETLPHHPDGSIDCTSSTDCPNTPTNDFPEVTSGLDFLLSTPQAPDPDARGANAAGTLTYNPAWALLDRADVGVAGHSLGAIAVTSVGQDDARVKAIVSFDNLDGKITLLPGAKIHAPALYFGVDYAFPSVLAPMNPSAPPDPEQHADFAYKQTKAAGVDTMLVVPRASTHYEFDYEPFPASLQASRYGERTAFYYTRAWFDRYLKHDPAATARLTAITFDGSADASSIGAGTFDPAAAAADPADPAAGNVPYKIGGRCVGDLLSFYYHSDYWLDGGGLADTDMRARGC